MKKYSFLSIVFIVYLIVTFVSWLVGTGFEETSYTFNVCLRICYSSAIGSIVLFILLQFEFAPKKDNDFYSQLLPFLEKILVASYTIFLLVYAFSYGINKISIKIVFPVITVLSTVLIVWSICYFSKKETQGGVSFYFL